MAVRIPRDWPTGVRPPGSEDFESTAAAWLFDVLPPECRQYAALRRFPAALALMARYHARGSVEGARRGYRAARTDLEGSVPPDAVDDVLAAYRAEGPRLAAVARAVEVVEPALRSDPFAPRR